MQAAAAEGGDSNSIFKDGWSEAGHIRNQMRKGVYVPKAKVTKVI